MRQNVTPERWQNVKNVLCAVLDLEPEQRSAYLDSACSSDPVLRREVESLLDLGEHARNSFLESPPVVGLPTVEETADEPGPDESGGGTVLGHYQLVQKIGEGGMGEVWLAEQKEPVRRRVALKLIKAGMNSREVIARFESERQALALMDHPAIARVFDAGSTPQGTPYFVMEYVAGVPITDYCDNHRLSTRERLELFVHICEGVQHAHQKAIIHRDLKPSNILVTEVDGRPAPKIIDFGVAKALGQRLTGQTMYTRAGSLVGTPEYMSPEQALSSGEDIDTRTDVYSLGVVFYELLAGVPPLDLGKISLEELLRRVREEEAPTPSSRIRTQDPATSTELASKRQSNPLALSKEMRGDLDAIALKALEKDRSSRYGSPTEFAADIGRYLRNEAVVAVAPSVTYRARKFARRHRAALVTASAFVLVLVVAAAVTIRQGIRANQEAAVARAVNDFLQNDVLAQASVDKQAGPSANPDPHLEVRTALDRAAARIDGKFDRQPEVEAAIRDTIGQTYIDLGESFYPEARKQFERALDLQRRALGPRNPQTLKTITHLGRIALLQHRYPEAEELLSQAMAVEGRVLGPDHPDTLHSMNNLVIVYAQEGKYPQTEPLFNQILAIRRRVLGPEHADTLKSMHNLAAAYMYEGKYAQAEALQSQTVAIARRVLGPEHPFTLSCTNDLTEDYIDQGKYAQAETLLNQILEVARRVKGPEDSGTLSIMENLGIVYDCEGQRAHADVVFSKVLDIRRRVQGPENRDTLDIVSDFAHMDQHHGEYAMAETYATQALAGRRHALGSEHPDTMASAADLALAYVSQGKFPESEPLAREAFETEKKIQPDDWQRYRAESLLGASLAGGKKYAEAEPLLLEGYQGMLARKDRMAASDQYHLELAHNWIVQLYQAWGKSDKAAEWRKK